MLKFSGKKNAKRRAAVEQGKMLKYGRIGYTFAPYTKTTPTYAVPIHENFEVDTLEGKSRGKAGDYLAVGAHGEMYPIDKAVFEETHELSQVAALPEKPMVCIHCGGKAVLIIGQQLTPGELAPYKHAQGAAGKGCPKAWGPLEEKDVREA
jgi:hypothetical protein